ncbi:tetratricopeptide repeat protein [Maribacter luteus]|uniref:tetratricopeptide repeat protein n=1 Tax=Maribacter luteus TaxID=2594478 RepID=UPI00249035C1|nr:tetratricopeptide repeat protein [Maribacter luteus]
MNIIGYIIYGLCVFITIGWCVQIRGRVKNEQATEKSRELQGFLMTLSLVLIPVLHLSPFHLLWMLPASFILGFLSVSTPLRILWIFSSLYFSIWYIGISNVGRKYYVAGEYDKAIEAYIDEIAKKPSSEKYFNLGLAYGKTGQHDKEIDAYEHAVILNPKRPELYFNLGTVYNDIGKNEKAINTLNEAIRLRPEYLKAHYTICKIYAEIGDRVNAKRELEIIKKLNNSVADELTAIINEA